MVVITGPLLFLTTSRFAASGGAAGVGTTGGVAVAALVAVASGVDGLHPESTDTAPIIALRIMKARRSTPAGASAVPSSRRMAVSLSLLSVINRPQVENWKRGAPA